MNERTHKIYSDKFLLAVLDLKHIELATEEDRAYQTDHWAGLFRSTTWEELKKLAENHKALSEAAETVYALSEDEKIRMQCEAREDYYRRTGWKDDKIKELAATVERQTSTIEQQAAMIQQQNSALEQQTSAIQQRDAMIQQQNSAIEQRNAMIQQQNSAIQQRDALIQQLQQNLAAAGIPAAQDL